MQPMRLNFSHQFRVRQKTFKNRSPSERGKLKTIRLFCLSKIPQVIPDFVELEAEHRRERDMKGGKKIDVDFHFA